MSKIIAIFGSTSGRQATSVLHSLSNNDKILFKAITRNPNSTRSGQLKAISDRISLVHANLNDKHSLNNALKGCDGVFISPSDIKSHSNKCQIYVNLLDKAIQNNIKQVVVSGGDSDLQEYFLKRACDKLAITTIQTPMFYQDITERFLSKVADNRFILNLPMNRNETVFCMDLADLGKSVVSIFQSPEKYRSKSIGLFRDCLTVKELLGALNRQLEDEMKASLTGDAVNSFLLNFSLDKQAMDKYSNVHIDLELLKELNQNGLNFNEWLLKNRQKIFDEKRNIRVIQLWSTLIFVLFAKNKFSFNFKILF